MPTTPRVEYASFVNVLDCYNATSRRISSPQKKSSSKTLSNLKTPVLLILENHIKTRCKKLVINSKKTCAKGEPYISETMKLIHQSSPNLSKL